MKRLKQRFSSGTIGATRTYFIHMSHEIDHERHSQYLPDGVSFAYDGLIVELNGSAT